MNETLTMRDEYESENSKLRLKSRQLEAKNKELEYDLGDVDRMAKRLQTDKDLVVKEADREMTEAKVNIQNNFKWNYYRLLGNFLIRVLTILDSPYQTDVQTKA